STRQVEQTKHAFEAALEQALEVRGGVGDPVREARGIPIARADEATHIALETFETVCRISHALAQRAVKDVPAALDQLRKQRSRYRTVGALAVDENLRERDRGDVLARLVIDHPNLATTLDQFGDALERDVTTGLCVVELAVCVALDQDSHGADSLGWGTVVKWVKCANDVSTACKVRSSLEGHALDRSAASQGVGTRGRTRLLSFRFRGRGAANSEFPQ